jgi:hypothetical protein
LVDDGPDAPLIAKNLKPLLGLEHQQLSTSTTWSPGPSTFRKP